MEMNQLRTGDPHQLQMAIDDLQYNPGWKYFQRKRLCHQHTA